MKTIYQKGRSVVILPGWHYLLPSGKYVSVNVETPATIERDNRLPYGSCDLLTVKLQSGETVRVYGAGLKAV